MDASVIERITAGIRQPLSIQGLCDLDVRAACGIEFSDALFELLGVRRIGIGLGVPRDPVLGGSTGLPKNAHPDHAFGSVLVDDHLVDDEAQNRLTFCIADSFPKPGQVDACRATIRMRAQRQSR